MLLSEHLLIISFLIISPHVCLFVSWLVHQSVGKPVGRSIVQSVGLFHFQWSYQSTCLVWIFVNIGTWFCIEIIIENIKNRHKIPKLFRVFVNIMFSLIQKPDINIAQLIQNWLDFNLWTPKLCYRGENLFPIYSIFFIYGMAVLLTNHSHEKHWQTKQRVYSEYPVVAKEFLVTIER